jgi:hypothetical protein
MLYVLFAKYNNNQVKEEEMSRAYSTHGAKTNAYDMGGKALRKAVTRRKTKQDVGGRIILK